MLNLYPNHIFWNKVLNQITVRKNALWRYLPVRSISVKGLGTVPGKKEMEERMQIMLGLFQGDLYNAPKEDKDLILELASEALSHTFNLLGSGPVKMTEINWHSDFKSGYSWPKGVFYKKQRQATIAGSDIKVPWELSRCHHLLWLGEAYILTNEECYAKEIVDEIEDWICENPLMYSVNWACTMDVAIRAVNWIYAVAMIMPSKEVTDSFISTFYKGLYQHGWFIFNNLEKNIPDSNNHLFSDYAGLFYLGMLFKDTLYGRKWIKFVVPEFYEEIRRQILPSGVQYERSVSYHRLMTELVSYPCFLLKRLGYSLPADIEYRVRSMYSFIANYTKNQGLAPLIEDNDDGRFLPFIRRDFRRHDYLLNRNSTELRIVAVGVDVFPYDNSCNRLYVDAGHAIIREGDAYLFVTNGGFSKYETALREQGTHTHNDRLSFELALGEDDIFVDPGSYVYTPDPDKCNEFHSTSKHNTIIVDEEEQNILKKDNVFLLIRNSRTTMFEMLADNECVGGYKTLGQNLAHKREFSLTEETLTINDYLEKSGRFHHSVLSLHLSPELSVRKSMDTMVVESPSFLISVGFEMKNLQHRLIIKDDTYSPSYGVLVPTKTICLEFSFDESANIQTIIKWQKKK